MRDKILEAAMVLAQSGVMTSVDAAAIATASGSTIDDFRQEFPADDDLLIALHGYHVTSLIDTIVAAIEGMPPGRVRLERGLAAFWSGCLARIPTRRLVKSGRINVEVNEAVRRRNRTFEHLLGSELRSLAVQSPDEAARLLRAMVEEVAQAEFSAGVALPPIRAVVRNFIDQYGVTTDYASSAKA